MKNRLLSILGIIVEKVTGKSCYNCKHCSHGTFCNNFKRYKLCASSIYPHGYEPK